MGELEVRRENGPAGAPKRDGDVDSCVTCRCNIVLAFFALGDESMRDRYSAPPNYLFQVQIQESAHDVLYSVRRSAD